MDKEFSHQQQNSYDVSHLNVLLVGWLVNHIQMIFLNNNDVRLAISFPLPSFNKCYSSNIFGNSDGDGGLCFNEFLLTMNDDHDSSMHKSIRPSDLIFLFCSGYPKIKPVRYIFWPASWPKYSIYVGVLVMFISEYEK